MSDITKIETELKDSKNIYMEGGAYLKPEEIKKILLKNLFIPNPVERGTIKTKSNIVEFLNKMPFNQQKGIIDFLLLQDLITQTQADTFIEEEKPDPNWQLEIPKKSIANDLGIRVIKLPDIKKALKNIGV